MTTKHQKMTSTVQTRKIDVLLFEDLNLLDVAGPVQAFEAANLSRPGIYKIRFVAKSKREVRSSCGLGLTPDASITARGVGRDLLVPGGTGVDAQMTDASLLGLIQRYKSGGGRVISVCSGAMILAAAGVLDGLKATTHWARQEQTKSFPQVAWDLDRINISEGNVFTSAGVTTGIDLALAIIQADCGPSVALAVARELIVQLRRNGGQSQYAFHLVGQFTGDNAMAHLIEKVVAQPHLDWSLETMAEVSGVHPRTLTRRFKSDVDETPAQFVERVRVDHARNLLQGELPLKRVAAEAGFGDLQRMRRAFHRRFGVQVSDYRSMFA